MSYRIELVPEARSEIKALPGYVRCQAMELLEALSREPRPARARELSGEPEIRRIWLGRRWRVAYEVDDGAGAVVVLCVRRKVRVDYESLPPWVQDSASQSGFHELPQIQRGGD